MASSFACRACKRALQRHASSLSQTATRRTTSTASASAASTSSPWTSPSHTRRQPFSVARPLRQNLSSTDAPRSRGTPKDSDTANINSASSSEPAPPLGPGPSHATMSAAIAKGLRARAGGSTETYVAYGGTEMLFRVCAAQAEYRVEKDAEGEAPKTAKGEDLGMGEGWWYEGLGLTPTFSTWAQVTFLHMYALTTRIRQFPAEHAPAWHQHLLDHFFYEAENRMVVHHNMSARGIRNRYLQDLFIQWRGVMAAYDEGLVKGDAMLAAALWRNIWKAEEINAVGLATVVAYLRREIRRLEAVSDEEFTSGLITFGKPEEVEALVEEKSAKMAEPFTPEEEAQPVEAETKN